jgi:undecaprenyl-diphosphatase
MSLAEARLLRGLSRFRGKGSLKSFFIAFTRLGGWILYVVLASGLAAILGAACGPALAAEVLAIALSVSAFMIIKNVAHRLRPYEKYPDLSCLLAPPDRFSFPSGHTMTSFAVCAALSGIVPPLFPFLFACGIILGLSRVYLGCHYPTDVIAGALVGGLIGEISVSLVEMTL